jgi:protein phosphatase
MRWEQSVQYASITDIGFRRRNNQDSLAVQVCAEQLDFRQRGHLFLVADGMGGHAVGELASKIAADTVPHVYYKSRDAEIPPAIKDALEKANAAINERGSMNRDFERMGTTCSALVLCSDGAVIGHVGDSRVYRVRDERIDQLSFDHSLQWELLRQGKMKPEDIYLFEPRNVITRSLGPEPTVKVDVEGPFPVLPGDTFLLCSDGLTGHVNDPEIGQIVRELPPGEACRLLVNLANLRGGSDNITVVIARVGDLPQGAGSTTDMPILLNQPEPSNAWWLAGFWVIALIFVLGVASAILGNVVPGSIVAGVGFLAGCLLGWFYSRRHPRTEIHIADDSRTTLWRPYRTASSKLNKKFLTLIAAIEAELLRTVDEEGWTVDRARHDEAFKKAQEAVAAGDNSRAFREYAKAIDALMLGVHSQRRQQHHEARWKKTATGKGE